MQSLFQDPESDLLLQQCPTVYWNGFGMGWMDIPLNLNTKLKLVKLLAEDIVSYCQSLLLYHLVIPPQKVFGKAPPLFSIY